jgi:hypothetical protein
MVMNDQPFCNEALTLVTSKYYWDAIRNLKATIESRGFTITDFAKKIGVNRANLNQCLLLRHDITVGLYVRCLEGLGLQSFNEHSRGSEMKLKDFLLMDQYKIIQSLIILHF